MCNILGYVSVVQQTVLVPRHCSSLNTDAFGITWLRLSLRLKVLLGVKPSVLQLSLSKAHRCIYMSTYHHCDLLVAKFPVNVLER